MGSGSDLYGSDPFALLLPTHFSPLYLLSNSINKMAMAMAIGSDEPGEGCSGLAIG